MKRATFFAAIFIVVMAAVIFSCHDRQAAEKPQLQFADGQFKILQLTDLHWRDTAANCATTEATIRSIVAAERPDLIMLTGDVVTYEPATDGWNRIVAILNSLEVPFAVNLGNHDAEYLSRDSIFNLVMKSPYYIGDKGPADIHGLGNTVIPIAGSDGRPAAVVYSLDSGDDAPTPELGAYDWIHFDQIAFYRDASRRFADANGGEPLPSVMFFHIPLPEYAALIGDENTFGAAKEGAGAPSEINSGMFASLVEMGDVMGVFVGHDHENDYFGTTRGIALGFGRCTGTQAYGDAERGGRVVLLHEGERRFDTWIATPAGREPAWHYPSALNDVQADTMTYLPAVDFSGDTHGVAYRYYEGRMKHTSHIADRMLRSEGTMANLDITGAPADDHFAYRFRTMLRVPERGVYRFHTYSDDGSVVRIDGRTVVDNDGGHSPRYREGLIALEPGFHNLEVDYFEDYMGQTLTVGLTSLNRPTAPLPDSLLYLPTLPQHAR